MIMITDIVNTKAQKQVLIFDNFFFFFFFFFSSFFLFFMFWLTLRKWAYAMVFIIFGYNFEMIYI